MSQSDAPSLRGNANFTRFWWAASVSEFGTYVSALAIQILLVSRGDPEANRQKAARYGLTVPIGLQSEWAVSRSYQLLGAPVAYLLDEQGIISADVAAGRSAITTLLSTLQAARTTVGGDHRGPR